MKKYGILLVVLLISLLGIALFQYITFNNHKLTIVICDVGQGDAILIRTPNGSTILIDSGPDKKVLACLGNHLPFWDRTIDTAILTHPHTDHYVGFLDVFQTYTVKQLITENLNNPTGGFSHFKRIVASQKIPTQYVLAGDSLHTKDGITLSFVGPTKEFLDSTSPNGELGESKEFASLETRLIFKNFTALFTGDSQTTELHQAIDQLQNPHLSVLQEAHHGSQYGFDEQIFEALNPSLVVISVGKNNRYGHPSPKLIDLLKQKHIEYLRTDQHGDIVISTAGDNFTLE